jgi:branched-chain amino acid transport system permease protein
MSERTGLGAVLLPSAAVLGVMVAGLVLGTYWQFVLALSIGAMVIGVGLVMLVGYARCITIASGAMMAIGAYASAIPVIRLGWPFPIALLFGTAVGALAGYLLALPAVRFRSHNLAMVTLVFQAVAIILLRESKVLTGGAEGLSIPPPVLFGTSITSDSGNLILTGVAAALAVLPLAVLLAGPFGKNLRALAANEVGARAFGIDIRNHLIAAFVISSAAIAFAGALSAPRIRIIDPDSYGVLASIFMLAYPIIGGMGSIWGGLMGGGALRILPEVLRPLADYIELIFCVMVVATVMFYPGGLVEMLRRLAGHIRGTRSVSTAPPPGSSAPVRPGRIAPAVAAPAAHLSALRIDGVSKSFGALRAVRDVSIDVQPGSLHGLMGPNGAGKTTLFNIVCGYLPGDAGRVSAFGEPVDRVPVERRIGLGMTRTFQHVAVYGSLSCFDNVLIGLGRNGVMQTIRRSFGAALGTAATRAERDAVTLALQSVGLGHAVNQPAASLSLGDQRRLEIARAIVSRPRIILLDEPVSGVGVEEAAKLRELLQAINRDLGVTMLVIEHNIGFLVSLCDRLSVMSHGEIIEEGEPHAVVAAQHVRSAYFGERVAA